MMAIEWGGFNGMFIKQLEFFVLGGRMDYPLVN
jgi:hypothetical protein